jgi:hypothetical protein
MMTSRIWEMKIFL